MFGGDITNEHTVPYCVTRTRSGNFNKLRGIVGNDDLTQTTDKLATWLDSFTTNL